MALYPVPCQIRAPRQSILAGCDFQNTAVRVSLSAGRNRNNMSLRLERIFALKRDVYRCIISPPRQPGVARGSKRFSCVSRRRGAQIEKGMKNDENTFRRTSEARSENVIEIEGRTKSGIRGKGGRSERDELNDQNSLLTFQLIFRRGWNFAPIRNLPYRAFPFLARPA